jgi:uncharacterized protein YbjT (DUF2867 family)
MNPGRILVTGATGNVGRPLVSVLKERGARIRLALREASKPDAELMGEGTEAVAFDFERPTTFGEALRGVDKIFLLRPPHIADPKRGIAPFVRAAKAAGVRHVVFLSLLGAEKVPVMPHRRIEKVIEEAGLPCTSLRAAYFMQNLVVMHRDDIRLRSEIFVPAGGGKTSFVDTRDIARVAAKALVEEGHEGKAYDLTGPEALDFYEVARILSEVLGKSIRYARPGAVRFVRESVARGVPLEFALVMTGIYTATRVGLAGRVSPVMGEILGRAPTTMRRFVEENAGGWR